MLVIAMNLKDVVNAKYMELVPREAKYVSSLEKAFGYRNETVYVVGWPERWWRENYARFTICRASELGQMEIHLHQSGCELIHVTLP